MSTNVAKVAYFVGNGHNIRVKMAVPNCAKSRSNECFYLDFESDTWTKAPGELATTIYNSGHYALGDKVKERRKLF